MVRLAGGGVGWWLNWLIIGLVEGFCGNSDGKKSYCDAGDPGSILGSGRSPGEGNGYPLHDYCLENPMDRRAWLQGILCMGLQRIRLSN